MAERSVARVSPDAAPARKRVASDRNGIAAGSWIVTENLPGRDRSTLRVKVFSSRSDALLRSSCDFGRPRIAHSNRARFDVAEQIVRRGDKQSPQGSFLHAHRPRTT